jgi:hypothetical protein
MVACAGPAPSPITAHTPGTPSQSTPSNLDFTCTLPIFGSDIGGSAFLSFPSRTVTAAPESGYYYDRAVLRWLPVHRQAVSPDGRRYAYTEGWSVSTAPHLHIADAATRTDVLVVTMPDPQPYQVADFTRTGIYLVVAFEGTGPGVWRVEPATGAMTKISNGYYLPTGAAWIGAVDSRDPHPQVSTMSGMPEPNRIDRRDDAGRITTWFYQPGYGVNWVAFAGSPALLVSAFQQNNSPAMYQAEYWLVDSPNHAVKLISDQADLLNGFPSAIADEHGIWLGGALHLVRRDGAIIRALDRQAYPANGCF